MSVSAKFPITDVEVVVANSSTEFVDPKEDGLYTYKRFRNLLIRISKKCESSYCDGILTLISNPTNDVSLIQSTRDYEKELQDYIHSYEEKYERMDNGMWRVTIDIKPEREGKLCSDWGGSINFLMPF